MKKSDKNKQAVAVNSQKKKLVDAIMTVNEMVANGQTNMRRSRIQNFSEYGVDSKHTNIYNDFGYQHTLTFESFYYLFERFALASAIVRFPVTETWKTPPRITDDSKSKDPTAWEQKLIKLFEETGFWRAIRGLDERQRVGRWGGLFLEITDGKHPQKSVVPGSGRLVRMRPLYEAQLEPRQFDNDPFSNNYGDPITWQVQESNLGDRNDDTGRSLLASPDRVITWAEGADDGTIYGKSALKEPFNDLVTCFKLIGAGGEGFFKNARGSQFFAMEKDASLTSLQQLLGASNPSEIADRFNEIVEDWVRGFDKSFTSQGMTRETISIDLTDPKPHFEIALSSIAAGIQYPMTVLIGQQTGRLASDEDQKQAAKTTKDRQENFAVPSLRKVIDHFIKLKLIDEPPGGVYEIVFDDPFAPSDTEKLDMLKKVMEINKLARESGQPTISMESALAMTGIDELETDSDIDSEQLGDDDVGDEEL